VAGSCEHSFEPLGCVRDGECRDHLNDPKLVTAFAVWGFTVVTYPSCGPGSGVGIATAYGLDGPGIESRWGRDFSTCPALRPTQPPVQWVPGLSRG
jgi:hypothetical protein